eukprot:6706587-Prymnesium_polylepis.1
MGDAGCGEESCSAPDTDVLGCSRGEPSGGVTVRLARRPRWVYTGGCTDLVPLGRAGGVLSTRRSA